MLALTACSNCLFANADSRLIGETIMTAFAEETETFGVDKTYLTVGEQLKINNPDGYKLKIYVDGIGYEPEDFYLTEEFYEKWIIVLAFENEFEDPVDLDNVYFSRLPVIYIDTKNGELPPQEDKSQKIEGIMYIQNNEATDKPVYSGQITLQGRGNTTWEWEKKPYKIKLDKKTDLYGMGKSKKYALLANYQDESLLRNTTASKLSQELGLTTMETVWADVIINGDYAGNYQLSEQVSIESARVDMLDWEEEAEEAAGKLAKALKLSSDEKDELEEQMTKDLTWLSTGIIYFHEQSYVVSNYYDYSTDFSGGYLFESSEEYDEESKFKLNEVTLFDEEPSDPEGDGLKIMMKSPEFLNTNAEMWDYVRICWKDFENAYKSENGYTTTMLGETLHYTDLADFDSMVSYWLLMEIMGNDDARYKSRYIYKPQNGKLTFGPPWDFDTGAGSILVRKDIDESPSGWKVSKYDSEMNFYREFLDDPFFMTAAAEKYWQIRPYLESVIKPGGQLDQNSDYLFEAGIADSKCWNRSEHIGSSGEREWENYALGYQGDTEWFKEYMCERIAWLDEQFETEDNLRSSLYTSQSAAPYIKSEDLSLELEGLGKDIVSEHAPADAVAPLGKDLRFNVTSADDTVCSMEYYINGLYFDCVDSFPTENQKFSIDIPADELYNINGKKNVLSVIAKDDKGKTVGRNYMTVVQTNAAVDEVAANAVIDKISAIGEVTYTDDCNTAVTEARAAYDALTEAQKALVTNYADLVQAEADYAELKVAAEQAAADAAAADAIYLRRHENKLVISGGKEKVYVGFTANVPNGYTVEDHGLIYYNSGTGITTQNLTLENVDSFGIKKATYWGANITDNGYGVFCVGFVKVRSDDGYLTTLYTEELGNSVEEMSAISKKVTLTKQANKAVVSNGKNKVFCGFNADIAEGYTLEDYGLIYYNSGTVIHTEHLTLENVDVCGIQKAKYWGANITDNGYGVVCVGFVKVKDAKGYVTALYSEELGGSFAALSEAAEANAANAVTLTRYVNKAVVSGGKNKVYCGFNAKAADGYTVEDYGLLYYNSGNVIHTEHLTLENVGVCGIQKATFWGANITDKGYGVVCVGFVKVKAPSGYITTLYTGELGSSFAAVSEAAAANAVTFTRHANKASTANGKNKVYCGFTANLAAGYTVEDYGLIYYNSGNVIHTEHLTLENVDVCGIKSAQYYGANITDNGYGVVCVGFVKVKDANGYITTLYTEELGAKYKDLIG